MEIIAEKPDIFQKTEYDLKVRHFIFFASTKHLMERSVSSALLIVLFIYGL